MNDQPADSSSQKKTRNLCLTRGSVNWRALVHWLEPYKMTFRPFRLFSWTVVLCLFGGWHFRTNAGELLAFQLRPAGQVNAGGVFLSQILEPNAGTPNIRICDAPSFGKCITLTRAQIAEIAAAAGLPSSQTNWSGAESVRITRRSRSLNETELLPLLTKLLQEESIKDRGELELHFSRPWSVADVPDEVLIPKVLELPPLGVGPLFLMRFELQTAGGETVGAWQVSLQARAWREILVAGSALKRGQPLKEADLVRERRDVLALRDNLSQADPGDPDWEIAEPLPAGAPLLARSLRPRTVVHRGQTLVAVLQDGALAISLKVEALEDGSAGQTIRVRNPFSRRDLHGKVLDEQRLLLSL